MPRCLFGFAAISKSTTAPFINVSCLTPVFLALTPASRRVGFCKPGIDDWRGRWDEVVPRPNIQTTVFVKNTCAKYNSGRFPTKHCIFIEEKILYMFPIYRIIVSVCGTLSPSAVILYKTGLKSAKGISNVISRVSPGSKLK